MIVLLYGHLARKYGKRHELAVSSPGEALRAFRANYPGFEKGLIEHNMGYHVFMGYSDLSADRLNDPASQQEVCRIVPSVSGAGITEALILMIVMNTSAGIVAATAIAGVIVSVATSLILSGISAVLFAPEKSSGGSERPENKPSYTFNGAVNTLAQGNPVPVGYGRMRVGSQVISSGLSVEQIAI